MDGKQLVVIIKNEPMHPLVDSGTSSSYVNENYRRLLKKVMFSKDIMVKVANGSFVRPIGKCIVRIL